MRRSTVKMSAVMTLLALLAGCALDSPAALPENTGGGGGSGGSRAGALDSANASAQANAVAMDFQLANFMASEIPTLGNGGPCTFNGVSSTFTCPVATFEGLNVSRTYTLFDVNGQTQSAYDALNTDSVLIVESMTGSFTGPASTGTLKQAWTVVLSGLGGNESSREWNGTGTDTTTGTVTVRSTAYSITFATKDSLQNIFVNAIPDSVAWPASGTIVRNTTVHLTAVGGTVTDSTITRRSQVDFNNTAVVPLTSINLTCDLHLDTRVANCSGL